MMRSILLWLSHNKLVRRWTTRWGLVRRAARRFVAGDTIEEAIQAIRDLSALGISATLDHLGENVETAEDAARATEDYLKALDAIGVSGMPSHVSVKLTALGLDLSAEPVPGAYGADPDKGQSDRHAGDDRHGIDGVY